MPECDLSKLSLFNFANSTYDRKTARVGDWIYRQSDLPNPDRLTNPSADAVTHHGVVVSVEGEEIGVFDLQIDGCRVVELAEFADGKPVLLKRRGIAGQDDAVFERARKIKDRPWSLPFWTCDDAAAYVHDGKSKGTQGMAAMMVFHNWGKAFGEALAGKR